MKPKITLSPIIEHYKRFRQRIVIKSVYMGNEYSEEYEVWRDTLDDLHKAVEVNLRRKKEHIL